MAAGYCDILVVPQAPTGPRCASVLGDGHGPDRARWVPRGGQGKGKGRSSLARDTEAADAACANPPGSEELQDLEEATSTVAARLILCRLSAGTW